MKLTVTVEKDSLRVEDIFRALADESVDWRDSGMDWDTLVNPNGAGDRIGPNDTKITWEITED